VKFLRLVSEIPRRKKPAPADRFNRFAYHHAVHPYSCTDGEIFGGKLVFCRNIGFQSVRLRSKRDLFAFAQIGESNQYVVVRIEFENFIGHGKIRRYFLPPSFTDEASSFSRIVEHRGRFVAFSFDAALRAAVART
jgi:hypothetical protein